MEFGVFHLFSGIGSGALGFARAQESYLGMQARFRTLGGVDVDPEACQDFERLTGVSATCLDLFPREDYVAFHGHEPPADWQEVTPADIRRSAGGVRPDVVFTSPPCQGMSALMPQASAATEKYQALNRLTLRGIALILAAWADDLPGLIILENVPWITSRGAELLNQIKTLLTHVGYRIDDGTHDLGEVGGLSQHRRRYLLVARHPGKVPAPLYVPPKRRVRAIGDALGPLPVPGSTSAGPMHRLPQLNWLTWLRLALIPAGGDWRDLQAVDPGTCCIVPDDDADDLVYAAPDARLGYAPRKGVFRVGSWTAPSTTVIGTASVRGSNGIAAVADPRLDHIPHGGSYRVTGWSETGTSVTGQAGVGTSNGLQAVADPRVPEATESGTWVIISADNTWHRPLTTLELAVLQGLPARLPNGEPLVLAGNSQARWRKRIGNAVPVQAAEAVARLMLMTLMAAQANILMLNVYATVVWVRNQQRHIWTQLTPPRWSRRWGGGLRHGV